MTSSGGTVDLLRLRESLKQIVVRACQIPGVHPEEIADTDPLFGGPGPLQLDSLDALEIAMALRREFGLEMDEVGANAASLRSIADLADFVVERSRTVELRNLPLV